jgi:hypothetical protein
MGGGGGGASNIRGLSDLVNRAREELQKDDRQRRNVFISFDYADIAEVNLLRGQAKNDNVPIDFNDWSVHEPFDSERAEYIKKKIADRINASSLTIVYMSDKTATSKWVNWEINKSIELGKHVIAVYKGDKRPSEIPAAITSNGIKQVPWSQLPVEIDKLK